MCVARVVTEVGFCIWNQSAGREGNVLSLVSSIDFACILGEARGRSIGKKG